MHNSTSFIELINQVSTSAVFGCSISTPSSGDEELKLKKQRDTSHTNHSELKKRLQCSTDALQQIALVTKATPASSNGDSGGRVNIGHGGGGKVAEHVTDTTTKVT